jgi:hypothetical protein
MQLNIDLKLTRENLLSFILKTQNMHYILRNKRLGFKCKLF